VEDFLIYFQAFGFSDSDAEDGCVEVVVADN